MLRGQSSGDGATDIRFSAGAPLTTSGGFALCSLCVVDQAPRQISPEQSSALHLLARQSVSQIELSRRVAAQERSIADCQQAGICRADRPFPAQNFDGSESAAETSCGDVLPLGSRMLKVLLDLAELEASKVSRPGALITMQRHAGRYNPQVLATAVRRLTGQTGEAAKPPSVFISLKGVRCWPPGAN